MYRQKLRDFPQMPNTFSCKISKTSFYLPAENGIIKATDLHETGKKGADAIILELKVNTSPEEPLHRSAKENYALRLKGKPGDIPKYTGRILAVGLSYDKTTKKHSCRVEEL